MSRPLVTLGVPVRNGAPMLRAALDSIVAQDYPNIEILVSDNASNDDTAEILCDFAGRHPVIRIIRQDKPLRAIDNFMFVLAQARGEFFAWCAHDDTRSPDFVSRLLEAFEDPRTVLAFGDLYVWNGTGAPRLRADYDFANNDLPVWRRLRKAAHMQCYHVYGLWRTSTLRAIRYRYTHWWSDMPIMLGAAAQGVFRYVPGPRFDYYEVVKTGAERAAYQDYREPVSKIRSLVSLFRASFLTVARTSNFPSGIVAACFLVEKYAMDALWRLSRLLSRA